MKEELLSETQITMNEADNLVIEQCEPVDQMVKHVIELYDYQEKKRKYLQIDVTNSGLIITLVLIIRVFVLIMLFSASFIVFETWDWFGYTEKYSIYSSAIDIYSFSGLLFLVMVILIIDVILTRKIKMSDLDPTKLNFLLEISFIKVYYRTVLLLCIVPVFVPQYIFHGSPYWYYRIQVLVSIILTVSAIEWLLRIPGEFNLRQILTKINPVTLFIGYYVTSYSLVPILTWIDTTLSIDLLNFQRLENQELEFYFLITILSLLFLVLTYDYWRRDAYQIHWSRKTFSRLLLIWIPMVCILGLTLLQRNLILAELFPNRLYNDHFFLSPFFLLFSFLSVLILISIPQINTKMSKTWVVFVYVSYSLILLNNLDFEQVLNAYAEEYGFPSIDRYADFLTDHHSLLLPVGIVTAFTLILILLIERDISKEKSSQIDLYLWTYRMYLFFLTYELGIVNLGIHRLGYLTNFMLKPSIRMEWIMDGLLVLVFIGLAVIPEIVSYITTGYETGLVKGVKRLV